MHAPAALTAAPCERLDLTYQVAQPAFSRFGLHNAVLERLVSGCRWTEGPVWFGDAGCGTGARRP